jgi:hypothetical protein
MSFMTHSWVLHRAYRPGENPARMRASRGLPDDTKTFIDEEGFGWFLHHLRREGKLK